MKVHLTTPNYVYSPAGESLMSHLQTVSFTVNQLTGLNDGVEPARIITDWRDDGPEEGEHNGWVSVIEWAAGGNND